MRKYIKNIFVLAALIFSFCAADKVFAEEVKEESPKISVVVTVYNTEKYLRRCLDSIINQNFKDIEIVCVNDGSKDNSLKILNEYAEKDSRVKVVDQENQGVSGARNTGVREASAKYLSFVDSDDYVDPKIYEKGYNLISSNDADVYIMRWDRFFSDTNLTKENPYYDSKVTVIGDGKSTIGFPRRTYGLRLGVVWDKIYRKDIITDNNFKFEKDVYYGEDTIFNWILFTRVKKVITDGNSLYFYRDSRPGSIMTTLISWHWRTLLILERQDELLEKPLPALILLADHAILFLGWGRRVFCPTHNEQEIIAFCPCFCQVFFMNSAGVLRSRFFFLLRYLWI